MEAHKFCNETCKYFLASSKHIDFAGVVDCQGKLLVGRKNIFGLPTEIESETPRPRIKFPLVIQYYIVQAISDLKSNSRLGVNNATNTIQISAFEFEETVLIIIPLNIHADSFLCIYGDKYCLKDDIILNFVDGIGV